MDETSVLAEFTRSVEFLWTRGHPSISIINLFKSINKKYKVFVEGKQHDASEFLVREFAFLDVVDGISQ